MPELDYITVKGFRSIAAMEKLHLQPINVVIGPNGSGKSNFIEVFAFLHAIREGRLKEYVAKAGGADKILHFGSRITQQIELHISFQSEVNQYEIKLTSAAGDNLAPIEETAFFWNKSRYARPYAAALTRNNGEAGISDGAGNKRVEATVEYVRANLDKWRLYHFHDTSPTSPLKRTADVNDNRFLRSDGSNLPAFLYYLQERHNGHFKMIENAVKRVAPFFSQFVLRPLSLNKKKIQLEWQHQGSDAYFDVSSMSDGTLRFIALSTLFLQPAELRPSVILVDEPELGLHPYAITMLASLIKQSSTKTQVLVSTQSALLLDNFQPQDVLVADRVDGRTVLTRLNNKNLELLLQDYSLGQLWEKNQLGGRPSRG